MRKAILFNPEQPKPSDTDKEQTDEDEHGNEIIFVTVEASTQVYPGTGGAPKVPKDEEDEESPVVVKVSGSTIARQPGIAVNDPIRLLPVIGEKGKRERKRRC